MRLLSLAALLAAPAIALTASPLAAEQVGDDAAVCQSGHGPAVQVNVQGLMDRTGELWLELYPANDADYLSDDHALMAAGKVFRRTRARLPVANAAEMCVRVPRPGRYALMLRHNRVGRDKFSFWSDGAGIPANQALRRSKPTVDHAAVIVGSGVSVVTIKMQYLHGFGFSPR